MASYTWKPIEDLPSDLLAPAFPELQNLARIWGEQAERLKGAEAFRQFNERLNRQWAIETGIIEGLYTIDRGTTELLIEKGIEASLIPHNATDKPAEQIVPILRDQEHVLNGLFDFVKGQRTLTTSYIKELHQALTEHQESVRAVNGLRHVVQVELLRGEWKRQPNNPRRLDSGDIHEYCPPEQTASEMDRLLEMHLQHVERGVSPEIEAAWLHHRFTQIHPFQDGNGRVARAIASLIFLRAHWFPLVIDRDIREPYIRASEQADHGNLAELIALFARCQKQAFLRAVSISEDVLKAQQTQDLMVMAIAERFQRRADEHKRQLESIFTLSKKLEDIAFESLSYFGKKLKERLDSGALGATLKITTDRNDDKNREWFYRQVVDVARQLGGYWADIRRYHAWVRLKLREQRQAEIVVSFHPLGRDFLGIMAVSAFVEYRDRGEDDAIHIEGPHLACEEIFEFTWREEESSVRARFEKWLTEAILIGSEQWRSQL